MYQYLPVLPKRAATALDNGARVCSYHIARNPYCGTASEGFHTANTQEWHCAVKSAFICLNKAKKGLAGPASPQPLLTQHLQMCQKPQASSQLWPPRGLSLDVNIMSVSWNGFLAHSAVRMVSNNFIFSSALACSVPLPEPSVTDAFQLC